MLCFAAALLERIWMARNVVFHGQSKEVPEEMHSRAYVLSSKKMAIEDRTRPQQMMEVQGPQTEKGHGQ